MKKIIYSLVIMIAAGSLFTSCVENTEPQGIRDLREAKADYLASLSKLREADAEKVKAEAALVQAKAATEQARAALKQAQAKAVEIQNEYDAEHNAITIAQEQANAEAAIKAAEVTLKNNEILLAQAEEALRQALVKIELEVIGLTQSEKDAISAYTRAYNKVLAKQAEVKRAEADLYAVTYNEYGENSVDAAKAGYESQIAIAEKSKAYFEAAIAENQEMTKTQIASYEEWVKKYDALQAENAGFKYDKAQIAKDSALNEYENKAALDSFYAAVNAKAGKIKTVEFKFSKFEKALPQVSLKGFSSNPVVSVVDNFAEAADSISLVTIADKKIKVAASTDKGVVGNVVDSLNIIIDALNREKVVVDQIVKDTTGIAALVAKTQHEYDSIKTVLEAGIANFGEIAEKQDAYEDAVEDAAKKQEKFVADTAKLTAKIKEFEQIWKKRQGEVKGDDSTVIWNAFIDVMKARAEVFPNDAAYYYFATPSLKGQQIVWKRDSVLFQNMDFAGIQKDESGDSKYGCIYVGDDLRNYWDGFAIVLNKALGQPDWTFSFNGNISWPHQISSLTDKVEYSKLISFGGKYRFNSAGKIWSDGVGAYVPKYVADAADKVVEAAEEIDEAKESYYTGIYEKFWGVAFPDDPKDSLKINFTEKTYTDPKVLVTFSGEEGKTVFYPAKDKKDAWIDYQFVNYNDSSLALNAIKKQLGQNNIKIEGAETYTLYAKTLAVAQFADAAVNYKENTQALAELTAIVKAVGDAFTAAKDAVTTGNAANEAIMVALTGTKDGKIVDGNSYVITDPGFIKADGSFNLAGEQKVLAEKWLADYAKKYAELEKQKKEIAATIADNEALSEIYKDYVAKLAEIEEVAGDTPDDVYNAILNQFNFVNAMLQYWIEGCEKAIATAEGSIKKLEAGYDPAQLAIEGAKKALDEAKKALEQAEAELAVAEAAYKQVLANHGITE